MSTLVAFSEQECEGEHQGSFCSITPYGGCSLYSMINHPDWFNTVTDQERLHFAKLLITQSLMVYAIMQQSVSDWQDLHCLTTRDCPCAPVYM